MVRKQGDFRKRIERRADEFQHILSGLYRTRWNRQRIGDSHCVGNAAAAAGTCGVALGQSHLHRERQFFHPHLVVDERHLVHRFGRMVGPPGDIRKPVQRRAEHLEHVHSGVYWCRRHRDHVGDRVRIGHAASTARANGVAFGQSPLCRKRRFFHPHVVVDERHLVHSFGCMVRTPGDLRKPFQRRADKFQHLHSRLHRLGRDGQRIRDGHGDTDGAKQLHH
jgi:hypothetical protein